MFLFLTAGIFHLTSIKSPRYDLHLFLGGLFIGLSTTVKQTTGLFAIGVIAVAIYQFRNRRLRGRSTLLCIVGLSLPWAAILVWALSQRTLGEMLRMIFQNDSKGGTWATFTLLLQTVTYWRFSIPATLLTVALLYSAATTNESNDSTRKSARYLSSAISLLYLVSLSTTTFDGVERASLIEGVALSITILGVLILGLHSSQVEHREHRLISAHAELYRVILFALFCLVVVWVSTTVDPTFIYNFPTRISVGPSLADFARLLSSKFLVLGVIGTLAGLLRNSFQHLTDLQRATTLSLGIATVCLQVMNSFAGTPTTETMIFGVLLGLIYVFDRVLDLVGQRFLVCIGLLVSLWTASFVVAQSQNPYSWIGISRPSLALTDKELTVRSEHFLVSDEDALFLLKLNSAVELARKSDSEVFFSARNVGLSELLDLQRYPSRCVVLWWDVCPESESQKDLIQLRKNPPRYALISIEPDEIVEDNELVWRFGEDSSLRSIQEFFTTRVKTGEYKVLFRMAPSSSPDIKTLFLKRMN
jgi:hypothetical protein